MSDSRLRDVLSDLTRAGGRPRCNGLASPVVTTMRSVGRILLIVVGIVVGLVVLVGGAGRLIGKAKLDTTYSVAPEQLALSVPIDTADIARGRHFATGIAGCIDCHGAHLQGTVFLDVPPFRMVAPNLTRGQGGIGSTFTDADF